MELEDIKKNWAVMEKRLERLEMESNQRLHENVNNRLKRVRGLFLRPFGTAFLCFTPFIYLYADIRNEPGFSLLTWCLLLFSIASSLFWEIYWVRQLNKIDCMSMTVHEICLSASRFQLSFVEGMRFGAIIGLLSVSSIIWDSLHMNDSFFIVIVLVGGIVGLVIGIFNARKMNKSINELQKSIADLQL